MTRSIKFSAIAPLLLVASQVYAIDLDVNSAASIKQASSIVVKNVAQIYSHALKSDGIPGLFGQPYYWYEGAYAFDAMIRYWAITGDNKYNDQVATAMLWQTGEQNNYEPFNQTTTEANDDQAQWALAAMTAAESKFPFPASGKAKGSWMKLATNVFETLVVRWDKQTCGGGLRWQIYPINAGYAFKNSNSNGNLFQLSARLAKATGNQTYMHWAGRIEEWSTAIGLVANGSVYDGVSTTGNCSEINKLQFTANAGTYLTGYSVMANLTNGAKRWTTAQERILQSTIKTFASTRIITETACATPAKCNTDQIAFRAILARALATTSELSPSLRQRIAGVVQASAKGAAGQCSGGSTKNICGSNWSTTTWDGTKGLSQDLSALEMIMAAASAEKALSSTGSTSFTSSGVTPSTTYAS